MKNMIPICDLHCDTILKLMGGVGLEDTALQVNLSYLEQAGVGLQVFACYIPTTIPPGRRFPLANRMIDCFEQNVALHADRITICRADTDVEEARSQGKIAAVLAVENGSAIESDLKNLDALYKRGVRLMTLIHSQSNDWVISSNDRSPKFDGLTDFGSDVIAAMNDLGMIIDVSHSHDVTVRQVLDLSTKPVIASHSCAHNLCPVPRNLKDDLIKGLAAGGGLVGVNLFPGFLDPGYQQIAEKHAGDLFSELNKAEEAAGEDMGKLAKILDAFAVHFTSIMRAHRVPVEQYLRHINYIVELIGEDYAAFGSDFDGIPDLPDWAKDCRIFSLIRQKLLESELGRAGVEKVCWSNFRRIFKTVCG
jgi:membrane dipeptidase